MAFDKLFLQVIYFTLVYSHIVKEKNENLQISEGFQSDNISIYSESDPDNVFNGVYFECFIKFSFTCLQKKTLLYLKELNKLNEVSVIGDYVKFVKLNTSSKAEEEDSFYSSSTDELSYMIDRAVDHFFDNHLIRFKAMGREVLVPNKVEEFVGRKKRKGGGGGGDGGDGGKKKMMMMVMMCMKMKLMMMLPAMMGMMGMMSFKGMMFSMMSFMISKMMLLMKILEKKGGGGGGGGGGDGGWAAGGGGGGAWMPAGGQDYGGGGYDANGQWQSRSIIEKQIELKNEQPIITYVKPTIRYNHKNNTKSVYDGVLKAAENTKPKSRKKRGIIDALQNAYLYWVNKVLGISQRKSSHQNQNNLKYKLINGVKYVYQPVRSGTKAKSPKELKPNAVKVNGDELKPIIVDDFNKGEIMDGPIESRMIRKKMNKMKEVSDTMDDNPWQ